MKHEERFEVPFAADQTRLLAEVDRLTAERDQLVASLRWFNEFDDAQCSKDLQEGKTQIKKAQEDLSALEQSVQNESVRVQGYANKKALGFNPAYWFSSERTVAAKLFEANAPIVAKLQSDCDSTRYRLQQLQQKQQTLEANHQRYLARADGVHDECLRLDALQLEIDQALATAEEVTLNWRRANQTLGPILEKLRLEEKAYNKIKSDIEAAETYDLTLGKVATPRGRAEVHQECRERFGHDKPRAIIKRLQKDLRDTANAIEKIKERFRDEYRLAVRNIRTVVIDGCNVLYRNLEDNDSQFIGAPALQAITKEISAAGIKVVIVFDSGVRGLLQCQSNREVAALFSEDAEVHVADPGIKADKVILTAISSDPTAFVVSNDRYYEFKDMDAVASNRRLSHHILLNTIQVPALSVFATF